MASSRLKRSLKATFLGMGANLALTAGKFAAGVAGHSHAMIADAVESTVDVFSSIIVWRGVTVAEEPADREHPYGHGKAEPLAAAGVALILLLAAAGIILRSAHELFQPRAQPRAFSLAVLIAAVVIKEVLYRFVSQEAGSVESTVLNADAWHHRTDAITSLAAAIGVTFALIGGPDFVFADDAAAIAAGFIVAWNGWRLLRPALNELMDAAPPPAVLNQIRLAAGRVPGVNAVEKCIVRKAGFQYFVDMHVEVEGAMPVREAHQIAHQVKDKVKEKVPKVRDVLVHIEPSPERPK
ncbi:MAG: cation diffusion facilitator family transporter [Limisphaerales bacterium]